MCAKQVRLAFSGLAPLIPAVAFLISAAPAMAQWRNYWGYEVYPAFPSNGYPGYASYPAYPTYPSYPESYVPPPYYGRPYAYGAPGGEVYGPAGRGLSYGGDDLVVVCLRRSIACG